MIDLPISEYMRNYYKENGFKFTDSEQATIFWRSDLPLPERLDILREIADKTDDETLKAEIHSLLDTEAKYEEWFKEDDSRYYYTVYFNGKNDISGGWMLAGYGCGEHAQPQHIFSDFNSAFAFGKDICSDTFEIRKAQFRNRVDNSPIKDGHKGVGFYRRNHIPIKAGDFGISVYRKDGVLLERACYADKIGDPKCSLRDAGLHLHNPFDLGDIVCDEKYSCLAIIGDRQEWWQEKQTRDPHLYNFEESTIITVFNFGAGGVDYDEFTSILDLKKVEQWDDELEWEVLKAASELMKKTGFIHIEEVAELYDREKAEKFNRECAEVDLDRIEKRGCRAEFDKFGELYCKWRDREKERREQNYYRG